MMMKEALYYVVILNIYTIYNISLYMYVVF